MVPMASLQEEPTPSEDYTHLNDTRRQIDAILGRTKKIFQQLKIEQEKHTDTTQQIDAT